MTADAGASSDAEHRTLPSCGSTMSGCRKPTCLAGRRNSNTNSERPAKRSPWTKFRLSYIGYVGANAPGGRWLRRSVSHAPLSNMRPRRTPPGAKHSAGPS